MFYRFDVVGLTFLGYCAFCLSGYIFSLFVACLDATMWWDYILVMLTHLPLAFLSFAHLCMLTFFMLALPCMCLVTWIVLSLCDSMLCFFLCLLALLALCHLLWCPCFYLHLCSFVYMFMHVSMRACFVIKHRSYPWSRAGSHLSLYTRSQVLFRNFAWWHRCRLYSNIMDL